MSADKLKDLWNEINESAEKQPAFSEEQVKFMLEGKANDIFSRITRNIHIGIGLLGLYVILMVIGIYEVYFARDGYLSGMQLSNWYMVLDLIVDITIVVSFIYFVIAFKRISGNKISSSKLKDTIESAIKILSTYRRFFYYIIAITVVSGLVGFVLGAQYGIKQAKEEYAAELAANPNSELIMFVFVFLSGTIFLGVLVFIVWYVFKKLYGDYIEKLRDCYDELVETE